MQKPNKDHFTLGESFSQHIRVYIWIFCQWCHKAPDPVFSVILPYMWSMGALTVHG